MWKDLLIRRLHAFLRIFACIKGDEGPEMANVARDVWTKAFAPTGQGMDQETWESMGRARSLPSGSNSPRCNFGASLETQ